jgi:D-alanine transaminase
MNAKSGIAYLNGDFLPLDEVNISPLDRGFLFADGVYEVVPVYHGRLFRMNEHLHRLQRSLDAIGLKIDLPLYGWRDLLQKLVERNGGGDLAVYLQITRGAPAVRDHGFPSPPVDPTVFAMAGPLVPVEEAVYRDGIATVTIKDIRWGACHIKSIALLANVLARQQAMRKGAADAILVRDGYLTEGTASNVFLVNAGTILTPLKDERILPGITRNLVLELASANAIPCQERNIRIEELGEADEVWLTSSTKEIVPVTRIDGQRVGAGVTGPLWRRMIHLYQTYKRQVCFDPAPSPPQRGAKASEEGRAQL